ncbi:MAG: hypothetical protein UT32_C0018G0025 [Parcubacteria group bacterium GW2011_GWC2_39_14]|nr:MAG: hypothetical protein UT32_C0018G0025 [Parcubacteria group bacterium GW2011_GWC2_39_14]KKR54732.1 MAG: hypothetical protein UT91_C0010G0025 [Parcubacteria group bacterium GW2011_GWA2_40_23]
MGQRLFREIPVEQAIARCLHDPRLYFVVVLFPEVGQKVGHERGGGRDEAATVVQLTESHALDDHGFALRVGGLLPDGREPFQVEQSLVQGFAHELCGHVHPVVTFAAEDHGDDGAVGHGYVTDRAVVARDRQFDAAPVVLHSDGVVVVVERDHHLVRAVVADDP